MKGTVLITGGAGFIGSHTADLLAKSGYKIKIVDNLSKPVHRLEEWPIYSKNKGYELIKGDASVKEDLEKVLKNTDYILHLAAYQDQVEDFSTFFRTNTLSTALIFEIINEKNLPIKKILYASSQFIYGDGFYKTLKGEIFMPNLREISMLNSELYDILDSEGRETAFVPFKENQRPNPTNSYGISKLASEEFILKVGKRLQIPSTIARYSIVQGARQSPNNLYSGALRIFVSQALSKKPITVYEDGLQLRDFVNVEDVARANLLLLEDTKADYEIFNVGGGNGYRIVDFAEKVKSLVNSPSEIKIGGYRKSDTRNAISDIDKIKLLGWRPIKTPEDSINEYLNWINKENVNITSVNLKNKEVF